MNLSPLQQKLTVASFLVAGLSFSPLGQFILGSLYLTTRLLSPLDSKKASYIVFSLFTVSVIAAMLYGTEIELVQAQVIFFIGVLFAIQCPYDLPRIYLAAQLRDLFVLGTILSAVLLVMALVFPQFITSYFRGRAENMRGNIGLGSGEFIRPGDLSELRLASQIAFHARVKEKVPLEDLYWRASTLALSVDGLTWMKGAELAYSNQNDDLAGPFFTQEILLEQNASSLLLGLDLPVKVEKLNPSAELHKKIDHSFALLSNLPAVQRRYTMLSTREPDRNLADIERYLELPPKIDARIQKLAQRLGDANGVLDYFRSHFRSSLKPGAYGKEPLVDFLFVRRLGYCEHFAGAFATLMRLQGTPSRVVLGYRGGELNPISGEWIVRAWHAHAWVEIWDKTLWLRIDPIDKVLNADNHPSNFWLTYLPTLTYTWDAISSKIAYASLSAILPWEWAQLLYGLYLCLAMILVWQVRKLLHAPKSKESRILDKAYQRYLRYCNKKGLIRASTEGPLAFQERCAAAWPEKALAIREFNDLYIRLRYGPNQVNAELSSRDKDLRDGDIFVLLRRVVKDHS